jgi:hypothetical protein
VVDGAAGDDERRGLGESTVPNARLPRGITSPLPPTPTKRLPFLELPPPIATGVEPVGSFALAPLGGGGGVDAVEFTLDEGLDTAAGGPRDQADALGAGDWAEGLLGVEALLICVRGLVNRQVRGWRLKEEERRWESVVRGDVTKRRSWKESV